LQRFHGSALPGIGFAGQVKSAEKVEMGREAADCPQEGGRRRSILLRERIRTGSLGLGEPYEW